jgi:hypothetical protein
MEFPYMNREEDVIREGQGHYGGYYKLILSENNVLNGNSYRAILKLLIN